jgi:phosphoglycerate dehydrogenase-like enzyme
VSERAPGDVVVVVTTPLEPELVAELRAVDPRLRVVYPEELIAPPPYPSSHPNATLEAPGARERWEELLDEAEVLFDFGPLELASTLGGRPRLRWVQASSAGVGRLANRFGLLGSRVTVTSASGAHGRPLAEFVLLAMLLFGKRTLEVLRDQQARRWDKHSTTEIRGKTVCIVGLGSIGREVARVVQALDARVVGTVRELRGRTASELGVERVEETHGLDELLPETDVLVIAVPGTPATERLVDARRLALLKPGAIVVNIGRGSAVDEAALVDALQAGRLRGAALDVFEREPLPADSPLWSLPNVLVSPHSAAAVDTENRRVVEIFTDNLRRYLAGEPLRNVVDAGLLY